MPTNVTGQRSRCPNQTFSFAYLPSLSPRTLAVFAMGTAGRTGRLIQRHQKGGPDNSRPPLKVLLQIRTEWSANRRADGSVSGRRGCASHSARPATHCRSNRSAGRASDRNCYDTPDRRANAGSR
jgi:hypothetical protein